MHHTAFSHALSADKNILATMNVLKRVSPLSGLLEAGSSQRACNILRGWILDGRLGAGVPLPQDDLAEQLGMSKIPIREALCSSAPKD